MNTLPQLPIIEAKTKKLYHRGQMRNGVHEGRDVNLDLQLDIWTRKEPVRCQSCGKDIERGDMYGDGSLNGERHCADCITYPENVEAWEITYKLFRKSSKHPNGHISIVVVSFQSAISEYIKGVSGVYGKLILRKVYPKPSTIQDGAYQAGLIGRKRDILETLQGSSISQERHNELLSELLEVQGQLDTKVEYGQ